VAFVPSLPRVVFGAAAVGLAMLAMALTNTEHPPAAGLALGFVLLEEWRWITPAAVLGGIVALCLIRAALRPALRDLL
jgi:CBS-domain-containing membrane protein